MKIHLFETKRIACGIIENGLGFQVFALKFGFGKMVADYMDTIASLPLPV